uniref:Uncharacterized protein n=1 Tax=Corynebacterium silvaticum TaxID=2320431 RepID=A0A7U5K8M2_9CORY
MWGLRFWFPGEVASDWMGGDLWGRPYVFVKCEANADEYRHGVVLACLGAGQRMLVDMFLWD